MIGFILLDIVYKIIDIYFFLVLNLIKFIVEYWFVFYKKVRKRVLGNEINIFW